MIIGIDLGTTNSVAAYMAADGPKLIPNALGEYLTPSVVGAEKSGKLLVGRAAKDFQVLEPERCVSQFKRFMGLDKKLEIGGKSFSPEQLSSLVLKAIKQDAEVFLNAPVQEAVITVPAYFNDNQRKATIAAGQIAGFDVKRILNEPTAAALAYGMHCGREDRTLMILDLGGGTFDVSIVEVFDGTIEVKASSGECFLGGEDFTASMAAYLLKLRGEVLEQSELKHPKMVSRLIQQCELAKRKLSKDDCASIRIPDYSGEFHDNSKVCEMTISQFNDATSRILERAELPIRRALGDAEISRDRIDQVLLVGGATRMRSFVDYVKHKFQREPKSQLNPDEVVAIGAAVQAGLFANNAIVEDLVVTDVSPFTLGIAISKKIGDENLPDYFLPIINRNTTIPVSRVDRVQTISPNQTKIDVHVYQGEGRMIKDNLKIGSFEASGIPPGPSGQEIDVRFTYDLNGVLEVEATIVKTGKKISHVITQHAKSLTPMDIKRAIEQMQTYKHHPRDELVNQAVLRRAERIYKELPLQQRDQLGDMIDGFEGVLQSQDKQAIGEIRQLLELALDRLEGNNDKSSESYLPW